MHLQLFGVSALGGASPMLEGIDFGWAPIGFAVNSLFQKTMSSRRLVLTYSNSVGYSCVPFTMFLLPVQKNITQNVMSAARLFTWVGCAGGRRSCKWLGQTQQNCAHVSFEVRQRKQATSAGLQPNSNGLQTRSDGLQPIY